MRPRQVVSPLVWRARTASMYARISARVDGRSARFRIALSPEPMPKNARPGAISSTVAMPEAATAGWRVIAFVTLGPMCSRLVACAHSASVAYISRNTDWLSATPTIEKPTSSASRASATADATERGKHNKPRRAVVIPAPPASRPLALLHRPSRPARSTTTVRLGLQEPKCHGRTVADLAGFVHDVGE